MSADPNYVTCPCQYCDGNIEFDANLLEKGETHTVECPHCHLETIIFVPEQKLPPPKPLPNSSEDVESWRENAVKGDPVAQCLLGYAYRGGLEVPKDDTEAVKWFRKSAEQGCATAQHELGTSYKNGCGVKQDYGEALKWWRKAADQGDPTAECLLGWECYNVQGVPKDYVGAVNWWRRAAKQGHSGAQFGLALAYRLGRGVPQNYLEAYKYANLAAAQGFEQASELRDDLDQKMSPSQITEGQRQATAEALEIMNPNGTRQVDLSRAAIPSEVRREVWRRDGGKCIKCGSRENLEYDHIIPVSKGGSNTARNIELLCQQCNRSKRDSIQ